MFQNNRNKLFVAAVKSELKSKHGRRNDKVTKKIRKQLSVVQSTRQQKLIVKTKCKTSLCKKIEQQQSTDNVKINPLLASIFLLFCYNLTFNSLI